MVFGTTDKIRKTIICIYKAVFNNYVTLFTLFQFFQQFVHKYLVYCPLHHSECQFRPPFQMTDYVFVKWNNFSLLGLSLDTWHDVLNFPPLKQNRFELYLMYYYFVLSGSPSGGIVIPGGVWRYTTGILFPLVCRGLFRQLSIVCLNQLQYLALNWLLSLRKCSPFYSTFKFKWSWRLQNLHCL